MKNFSTFIPVVVATGLFAISAVSANATKSGAEQLRELMRPHAYIGGGVSQAARVATGNPNILVLDRRHSIGDIYSCTYTFRINPQRRILECD